MTDLQAKQSPEEEKPNSPSPLLHLMEERVRIFELTEGKKSGLILGFISAAVFAFASIASEMYMPTLPIIEVMFVVYLVAFLFNYYLIRDGDILPFIEDEAQNFVAKIAGLSAFISTILFIYSSQKCELQTTLLCFGISWIFYASIEEYAKKQTRISISQFIAGIAILGLSYAILKPNFSPELKKMIGKGINNQDTDTPLGYEVDNTHIFGVIAAVISGVIFAYSVSCIRYLKNSNFITVTHIVVYIQVPFIPVFFPLQNLGSPSSSEWLFMCVLGIIVAMGFQIFVRSVQIEQSAKSLLAIPQFIAMIAIFSMLLGVQTFCVPTASKCLSAVCILVISWLFFSTVQSTNPDGLTTAANNQGNQNAHQEAAQINIPLEEFNTEKNGEKTLEQKLLQKV